MFKTWENIKKSRTLQILEGLDLPTTCSCGEQGRACGRDPPKKNKKMDHYMLCLSYPQAQEGQINSLQLSNNIL